MPVTKTVVTIQDLSTEYIRVPVYAKENGQPLALGDAGIEMALIGVESSANPVAGDWFAGSWDYDSSTETYYAQGLIGPSGGKVATVGSYSIWLRVTHNTEQVVKRVGTLRVE